ncbi:MAG: ABC transporter permease subunit, partial [Ruminiclostridium sp.]|nr:ABC transporter permease subunit [Ruminiclostridium sp.]
MSETEKKKGETGRKLPKKLLITIIVILVLIAVCIPLVITAPTKEDFLENIPQSYLEIEARRESVPSFDSIGIMTSYKAMKQIDASNVVSVSMLGIAGNVIVAGDNPVLNFFVNFVAWLPALLNGAKITILLTLTSVVTGVLLSVFIALGKMAKFKPVQYFCRAYIFFFRGTPLLMQLYFLWFGLPLLWPALTINDRFVAAWIAFSLNSAAY